MNQEELEAVAPMAQVVLARMKDEGGNYGDVEEYVDDLIAFTRENHPELDEASRWIVIRANCVTLVKALIGADN